MDKILKQLSNSFSLLGDKIYSWIDKIVLTAPNIILVLVTLLVGFKLIKFGKKLINKLSQRFFPGNVVIQNLVNNIGGVCLFLILFLTILTILGLQGPITTILASAGVVGLALGLALQDPLMNLFSGIIMSVKHVFNIGDFIESNGYVGEVKDISLKSTVIRMLSGEEVNIPNKLVLQAPVKNFTTNGLRRVELTCGISYNEDLEEVKRIASDALRPLALENVKRQVEFIYTSFGDSSINFQVRFWTDPDDVWQYLEAKSTAIITLKKTFDKHNINIPYPIRTIDFPIKGDKKLIKSNLEVMGLLF